MNDRRRSIYIAVILAMVARPVSADMFDLSGIEAWETCALCHSADGISPMSKFPKLAGQKPAYIKQQVLNFRQGKRHNDGGQMQAITTEIDLSKLDSIASYFSSLPSPLAEKWVASDAAQMNNYQLGKQIFLAGRKGLPACASCHSDKDNPAPWLAAQHAAYLQKQLLDFQRGARGGETTKPMPEIAASLRKDEIEAVVFYLSVTQGVRK